MGADEVYKFLFGNALFQTVEEAAGLGKVRLGSTAETPGCRRDTVLDVEVWQNL